MADSKYSRQRYATSASRLHGQGLRTNTGTALDFWKYGFSDTMSNVNRGPFGEWLVASLLGVPVMPRDIFREYDFEFKSKFGKVKIDVKSGACLQIWGPTKRIDFEGIKPAKLAATENKYLEKRAFWADLYIFAVHVHGTDKKWDAFNLDQWRFWILRKKDLAALEKAAGADHMLSISHSKVKITFAELETKFDAKEGILAKDLKRAVEHFAANLATRKL